MNSSREVKTSTLLCDTDTGRFNFENKPRGLYFLKALLRGLFLEGRIYGGMFAFQNRLGLYWEGNMRLKIYWASL